MKSTSYTKHECEACDSYRQPISKLSPIEYWSMSVQRWVKNRLYHSSHIPGLANGCLRCGRVYNVSAIVLVVLLDKLGIGMRRYD